MVPIPDFDRQGEKLNATRGKSDAEGREVDVDRAVATLIREIRS